MLCCTCWLLWLVPCRSKNLQLVFGVIPSTLSRDLKLGLLTYLDVLRHDLQGLGRIVLARPDEQRAAADYLDIARPFPPGLRVWAFCDGTVFRVRKAPAMWLDRLNFSGYHQMVCSSTVLVFLPNGVITYAVMDRAGKTHDSAAVAPLVSELRCEGALAAGHHIAGDGAFAAKRLCDVFVAPVSSTERVDRMAPVEVARRNWVAKNRAANEWVIQNVKTSVHCA